MPTYPFSAGTLAIEGGVPFGVAAAAPLTFTTAVPRNKNRHCCWYGTSGADNGYSLRLSLDRVDVGYESAIGAVHLTRLAVNHQ